MFSFCDGLHAPAGEGTSAGWPLSPPPSQSHPYSATEKTLQPLSPAWEEVGKRAFNINLNGLELTAATAAFSLLPPVLPPTRSRKFLS